ncbi:hypothetical protein ACO0LB_17070 [Undibacterium sp. SXout7W]|uniref:hypothetical protein n=1 Tax=Undibacterium sp. SXout7W TaxID=3413049 RepID=UPI003BF0BE71
MLLFIFIVFVLLHDAPWPSVKLPLLTVALGLFSYTVHLLARHYTLTPATVKLSTETVDKSV